MSEQLAVAFEQWLDGMGKWGVQDEPLEFDRHQRARDLAMPGATAGRRGAHPRRSVRVRSGRRAR
jgi:hypothetical protein